MNVLTIENKYGVMVVHTSKLEKARHEWTAANQFDIYIKGVFKPLDYDAARNLALQAIIGASLPAIALKRVTKAMRPNNRLSSDTRKMF